MAGHSQTEYEGVATFFNYLSTPAVQADWHQFTGYLPITTNAYYLTKGQGVYNEKPGMETALKQMTLPQPDREFQGIALRQFCADARHYV